MTPPLLSAPNTYPRDLLTEIPLQLPLAFVFINNLTTTALKQWLAERSIGYGVETASRKLHGALVARGGRGLIFIDSNDDVSEQQFTAAHETVHFTEDHLKPRRNALRAFGESIRPALDGQRAPTPEEAVSSILQRVPLGVQVHLMARTAAGSAWYWDTEKREQRADRLALELLAPATTAMKILQEAGEPTDAMDGATAAALLAKHFGLPIGVAHPYATLLIRRQRRYPTLSETLIGAGNERD